PVPPRLCPPGCPLPVLAPGTNPPAPLGAEPPGPVVRVDVPGTLRPLPVVVRPWVPSAPAGPDTVVPHPAASSASATDAVVRRLRPAMTPPRAAATAPYGFSGAVVVPASCGAQNGRPTS